MEIIQPDFIPYPLLMDPVYAIRVWGGDRLAGLLGKVFPTSDGPFGESWELSDHPAGHTRIANGVYSRVEFGELLRCQSLGMINREIAPERYPLMIKFIDAAQTLSIQVHPDDAMAKPMGDRGKTECWFIMACDPRSTLISGLVDEVTPQTLTEAIEQGKLESLLCHIPIRPGDFIEIPAGRVHAIPAGALVCEIQQASDLTYRLWDWDRKPARTLHIEEACQAIKFNLPRTMPENVYDQIGAQPMREITLVENPFFRVSAMGWKPGTKCAIKRPNPHGYSFCVVQGSGIISLDLPHRPTETLKTGRTWFIPAGLDAFDIEAATEGLVLLFADAIEI